MYSGLAGIVSRTDAGATCPGMRSGVWELIVHAVIRKFGRLNLHFLEQRSLERGVASLLSPPALHVPG
jgi:hypothetical protein